MTPPRPAHKIHNRAIGNHSIAYPPYLNFLSPHTAQPFPITDCRIPPTTTITTTATTIDLDLESELRSSILHSLCTLIRPIAPRHHHPWQRPHSVASNTNFAFTLIAYHLRKRTHLHYLILIRFSLLHLSSSDPHLPSLLLNPTQAPHHPP